MEVAAGRVAASSLENGRDIYNYRCYFCHGYGGDAKTVASSYLTPPPRDFTATDPAVLSRATMLEVVTHGKPNTAMMGFAEQLSAEEIAAVVDFVRETFMSGAPRNTRYHTAGNGWPDHDRYRAAFPFALGEIGLDVPWESLTAEQQQGRRLFMTSCITCHDRAGRGDAPPALNPKAISYPRGGYSNQTPAVDAVSGASPYDKHEAAPATPELTPQEREGEALFQGNCAFCHAADGSGKNWIGSFLQPHPRNLGDSAWRARMTRERLREVIAEGLPGTTMSAWKNVLSASQMDALVAYIWTVWLDPPGRPTDG